MRNMTLSATLIAALVASALPATAQTPPPPPAPAHHGILSHLLHHPAKATPAKSPIAGSIIGNKKSHVYHLAGDKGSLPSAANRVYFRTQAQAIAAGYHHAGVQGKIPGAGAPHRPGLPMPLHTHTTH